MTASSAVGDAPATTVLRMTVSVRFAGALAISSVGWGWMVALSSVAVSCTVGLSGTAATASSAVADAPATTVSRIAASVRFAGALAVSSVGWGLMVALSSVAASVVSSTVGVSNTVVTASSTVGDGPATTVPRMAVSVRFAGALAVSSVGWGWMVALSSVVVFGVSGAAATASSTVAAGPATTVPRMAVSVRFAGALAVSSVGWGLMVALSSVAASVLVSSTVGLSGTVVTASSAVAAGPATTVLRMAVSVRFAGALAVSSVGWGLMVALSICCCLVYSWCFRHGGDGFIRSRRWDQQRPSCG